MSILIKSVVIFLIVILTLILHAIGYGIGIGAIWSYLILLAGGSAIVAVVKHGKNKQTDNQQTDFITDK